MLNLKRYNILLLIIIFYGCCSSSGDWEGSIKTKDNVRIIYNTGRGANEKKYKESLEVILISGEAGDKSSRKHHAFTNTCWIDFDDHRNVYTLDRNDQIVTKLNASGEILLQFGRKGQGPGELAGCTQFVWVNHKLYFANRNNMRIEVFNDHGSIMPSVDFKDWKPAEIFYHSGHFYIGQYQRHLNISPRILQFDKNFNFEKEVFTHKKFYLSPDKDINLMPLWLISKLRLGLGGLWLIYYLNNRIDFIDLNGRIVFISYKKLGWELMQKEGKTVPEYPVHGPCDIDPEGNLYVIYNTPKDWRKRNEVYKYGIDGRLCGKVFTLPIEETKMIRFDDKGYFYFSDGISLYKARIIVEELN